MTTFMELGGCAGNQEPCNCVTRASSKPSSMTRAMDRILSGNAYDENDNSVDFSLVRTIAEGAVDELFIMSERALNEPIGCPGIVARSPWSSCIIRQTRRTPSLVPGSSAGLNRHAIEAGHEGAKGYR